MKYLSLFLLIFSVTPVFGVTPHLYVADKEGSSIRIIDVVQDSVQSILDGFSNPRVVKVTPDGRLAIVGENSSHVRVIDTITHTLLPMELSIHVPVALAIAPNDDFFYVASSNDTISVVRITDFAIVNVIAGFHELSDVKITPDGACAYATNAGNGTISVIRTSDHTVINTIAGMARPLGVTFTRDGDYAYVTDPENNIVYVVNTSSLTITDTLLGFNTPKYIAMTTDKNYAYITNAGSDRVSKLRLLDNLTVGELTLPSPQSIAVTEFGEGFLYVGSHVGAVYKIRILDDEIVAVLPGFGIPSNISFTNNNAPGISLNGCQITTSSDTYNHITWSPAPGTPDRYKIYQDASQTKLLASLDPTVTYFDHTGLLPGQTYWYYLLTEYPNGFTSTQGFIKITPVRTCSDYP